MIEAIDLTKRYSDGTLALDALNLHVQEGEIYCLLGAKGSGKTTAVDLFLGFTPPTAGRARIDGIDVAEQPMAAKARVAFAADSVAFYRRLSPVQNLAFFAGLGAVQAPSRHDCEMALREVGLPESAFHARVAALDPGSVRKLGLAVVLLKNAPALVLDEPLSGLDPQAAAELVETLSELRDRGRAILITMQDLYWARHLADRVGILQEGRHAMTRTREELRYENLERLYLDYMRGGLHARAFTEAPREEG